MPALPLGGWHKLDNTLIIKFTMKNVFCSAGRDEIKPCFGFSLFELLVHRLYGYCVVFSFFFPPICVSLSRLMHGIKVVQKVSVHSSLCRGILLAGVTLHLYALCRAATAAEEERKE